jgi:superfamily I DNA/RNA helicase
VGDRPNGLLLIGDTQQAVHPGGWRLVDAGIPIRGGRAIRLKTNYRNGANILAAANEILPLISAEDLDGTAMAGTADLTATRADGEVIDHAAPSTSALERALIEAVRTFVDRSGAALLCRTRIEADDWMTSLRRAGIGVQNLERYDATTTDVVKVGTFWRAKGLDFKAVFIPRYDLALKAAMAADAERASDAAKHLYIAVTRARDLLWRGVLGSFPRPPISKS